tara:strand:- start:458 stop:607 length:150 start_codon:yes stop_codon:yes gene_type:complete
MNKLQKEKLIYIFKDNDKIINYIKNQDDNKKNIFYKISEIVDNYNLIPK